MENGVRTPAGVKEGDGVGVMVGVAVPDCDTDGVRDTLGVTLVDVEMVGVTDTDAVMVGVTDTEAVCVAAQNCVTVTCPRQGDVRSVHGTAGTLSHMGHAYAARCGHKYVYM
jgi:hypothetical protein